MKLAAKKELLLAFANKSVASLFPKKFSKSNEARQLLQFLKDDKANIPKAKWNSLLASTQLWKLHKLLEIYEQQYCSQNDVENHA